MTLKSYEKGAEFESRHTINTIMQLNHLMTTVFEDKGKQLIEQYDVESDYVLTLSRKANEAGLGGGLLSESVGTKIQTMLGKKELEDLEVLLERAGISFFDQDTQDSSPRERSKRTDAVYQLLKTFERIMDRLIEEKT